MALILNTKEEKGLYQKIMLDRSFININGLYVATVVFENKNEREKDKSRSVNVDIFFNNVSEIINNFESLDEEQKKEFENEREHLFYVVDNFESLTMQYPNSSKVENVKESTLIIAEKYGFKREWYLDPIKLIRKDIIRVDNYKKQEFDLPTFYESLKKNVYTDENGNLLVLNDL